MANPKLSKQKYTVNLPEGYTASKVKTYLKKEFGQGSCIVSDVKSGKISFTAPSGRRLKPWHFKLKCKI